MTGELNSCEIGVVTNTNDEYVGDSGLNKVQRAQNGANETDCLKLNRCYSKRQVLGRADSFGHGIHCMKKVCNVSSSSAYLSSTLPFIKSKKYSKKRVPLLSSSSHLSSPVSESESNSNSRSPSSLTLISNSEDIKFEFGSYVRKLVNNIGVVSNQTDNKSKKEGLLSINNGSRVSEDSETDDCNNISVVSSLESIEWSPEERVIITDMSIPIPKHNFYSNWKKTMGHQENPKTPQFRIKDDCSQFDLPLLGVSSDSEGSIEGSGYSSKCNSTDSFSNLCGNDNAELIIGIAPCSHLSSSSSSSFSSTLTLSPSREYNNTCKSKYHAEIPREVICGNVVKSDNGVSESNIVRNSPFIPIRSNMIWRNTLDLFLSQWTDYFSRRHSFDSSDVENAIQFFIGLDNSTLNAVTSSLVHVSHCARYSQIRKLNDSL
ncbi:hypothetical protein FG386_001202 [Cryptosporidium ryanae]|uniref:uncharacterized protein n=1 Tax=Cryptosporidium ryanae TaxID=515981 RepID=UPI00351A23A8|nr:hypothetical protein FG386_001202 [Cryptosporidium ryanae]